MEPGDVIADRFVVHSLAGSGGMGAVYRASDRQTGEWVALKVLLGTGSVLIERFEREARLLAELQHPGIVRFVSYGRTDDKQLFLAMQWLDGEDLATRLANTGLTLMESVTLARALASALAAAHASGIVHRDIKPSNILLVDGSVERATLLDFGVARMGGARSRAMTRTGALVGTPGYMAPEQARGDEDLDARADVFSVGCVLFECLTGRYAFEGEHPLALLAKILVGQPPHVREICPEVPLALDALVARTMSKDRAQRPRDAGELLLQLDALGPFRETAPVPGESRSAALTIGEQRLLSVVLVDGARNSMRVEVIPRLGGDGSAPTRAAPTYVEGTVTDTLDPLRGAVAVHGGRVEPLADGSAVVLITGAGAATDQASQAARCALAIRAVVRDAGIALATGRGEVTARFPAGDVIDRAASLLQDARAMGGAAIRVDEVTAGLLDTRFHVTADDSGLVLQGERELIEAGRTILGHETPCVGRDRELATLEALWSESSTESVARAVLVTAEAGVGKSRVRWEFLRRVTARAERVEIWLARGDPMSAGAPFGILAQAIRRAAGIQDGESMEGQLQKLRARVGRNLTATDRDRVATFLSELIGLSVADPSNEQLHSARQDAMLMGDQMRRAWEDFLAAECRAQPVLFVLEDLHWGDLPTVRFLDAALRNLSELPWMVVAFARPEVHELFPRLWADRALQELNLVELSRKASERLVRHVLGAEATDEIVSGILERAGGNAFFLEELIRGVAAGSEFALPETVLAVVQARLEALGPDTRRAMRAASVFGMMFWSGGVRALLGGDTRAGALDTSLEELIEREVVAPRGEGKFPGEREFVFRHAFLRDAAYAMLTERDRVVGHKLAGEWLEAQGERDASVLAEHFERGAEPARAVAWYARAAEQALEGNDFAATVKLAEHAVASGVEGEALGLLRRMEAEAHKWSGSLAEAERLARDAIDRLPRGSPAWCSAVGELVASAGRRGNQETVAQAGEALRISAAEDGLTPAHLIAISRAGVQLLLAGHPGANALFEVLEGAGEEQLATNPSAAAHLTQTRSMRASVAGDPARYIAFSEAAVSLFERAGDLRNVCAQRVRVAYARMGLGDYARAVEGFREGIRGAERVGVLSVASYAKHNLGFALMRAGELDEALAVEREAVEAALSLSDKRLEGGSRMYLAMIHLVRGDVDQAEAEARNAVAVLESTPPLRVPALGTLAEVLLARNDVDQARGAAMAGLAQLESLGRVDEGELQVLLVHAEALEAAGERAAARDAIARARTALHARAAKIADPASREAFLTRVPEHARIVEFAREWIDEATSEMAVVRR